MRDGVAVAGRGDPLGAVRGVMRRRWMIAAVASAAGARRAGAQTVVPLGARRFAVPDGLLESFGRDGFVMAASWPGLEGAMGRSLPPRTVLTIGVRIDAIDVAEEVRRVRRQAMGLPSPRSRFGLQEVATGRIRPDAVFLVDDLDAPRVLVTYSRGAADPTGLRLPVRFDEGELRISVSLDGTVLSEWRAIRDAVAGLVGRLEVRRG